MRTDGALQPSPVQPDFRAKSKLYPEWAQGARVLMGLLFLSRGGKAKCIWPLLGLAPRSGVLNYCKLWRFFKIYIAFFICKIVNFSN